MYVNNRIHGWATSLRNKADSGNKSQMVALTHEYSTEGWYDTALPVDAHTGYTDSHACIGMIQSTDGYRLVIPFGWYGSGGCKLRRSGRSSIHVWVLGGRMVARSSRFDSVQMKLTRCWYTIVKACRNA